MLATRVEGVVRLGSGASRRLGFPRPSWVRLLAPCARIGASMLSPLAFEADAAVVAFARWHGQGNRRPGDSAKEGRIAGGAGLLQQRGRGDDRAHHRPRQQRQTDDRQRAGLE